MFRKARKPALSDSTRQALEEALSLLEFPVERWRGDEAEVERHGERMRLDVASLGHTIEAMTDMPGLMDLALTTAETLGLKLSPELMADFPSIRHRLRPRIVPESVFQGPDRAMCRRPSYGGLYKALAVGNGAGATWVTTPVLDVWPLDFDDAMMLALDNIRGIFGPDTIHEVVNTNGVVAIVSDQEPASSASLILKDVLPDQDPSLGVLFAVPGSDIMVALPVERNAGAHGFANLVQVVFTMAAGRGDDMLSDAIFWATPMGIEQLHTTCIEEDGSRRVHVEAQGVTEQLFRVLGALD